MIQHAAEKRTLKRMLAWKRKGLGAYRILGCLNDAKIAVRSGRPWSFGAVPAVLARAARRAAVTPA